MLASVASGGPLFSGDLWPIPLRILILFSLISIRKVRINLNFSNGNDRKFKMLIVGCAPGPRI